MYILIYLLNCNLIATEIFISYFVSDISLYEIIVCEIYLNKFITLQEQGFLNRRLTLNVDDLPEEIFIKIFGYLKYEELCQVGR